MIAKRHEFSIKLKSLRSIFNFEFLIESLMNNNELLVAARKEFVFGSVLDNFISINFDKKKTNFNRGNLFNRRNSKCECKWLTIFPKLVAINTSVFLQRINFIEYFFFFFRIIITSNLLHCSIIIIIIIEH